MYICQRFLFLVFGGANGPRNGLDFQKFREGMTPWSQRDSAAGDNYYGVVVEEFLTIKR